MSGVEEDTHGSQSTRFLAQDKKNTRQRRWISRETLANNQS